MNFANEFDLHHARNRFGRGTTPNRLALTMVVDRLREWSDNNSDGWAYWPKPVRAATRAIDIIMEHDTADISDADLASTVKPIKAFLTRQKVSEQDRELILRAVQG